MSSVDCFFCGHAIPLTQGGESCTNCGAPLAVQSHLPTLPLERGQTQAFVANSWFAEHQTPPLERAVPGGKAAGLLGKHPVLNGPVQEETTASAHKQLSVLDGIARLEGVVDTPPTRNTVDVPLEWWSQGMLRLFFPVVFTMLSRYLLVAGAQPAGEPTPQPKPTMTVYTIRVRRDDQTLGEARLEGDLIEGEPSLGDRLLLRGHFRGNTLIVGEGYNQSFDPPMRIKIRPPLPRQRARVAVMVLSALLLLTTGLFLSFLPLFAYHAGAAHQSQALLEKLQHFYLAAGIAFGALAFCLYSISGVLVRILMALFVLIAGLAVYLALWGAGLPPLPIHL